MANKKQLEERDLLIEKLVKAINELTKIIESLTKKKR